jgi:hypothetical protein
MRKRVLLGVDKKREVDLARLEALRQRPAGRDVQVQVQRRIGFENIITLDYRVR